MKTGKIGLILALIIILFFAVGIYFYPQVPERMASHWNGAGQADGYTSRFWGVFLMPLISVGLALLLVLVPRIDPLKANVAQFKKYYYGFVIVLMAYMFYLYLLTLFWNLGTRFDMTRMLVPAFAVLFYAVGMLVQKSKRNWFIGIRTPWTLSNEKVWDKTHLLGGRLLKAAALVSLLGIFVAGYAIWFILTPVVLVFLFTTVYSYFAYQKEKRSA